MCGGVAVCENSRCLESLFDLGRLPWSLRQCNDNQSPRMFSHCNTVAITMAVDNKKVKSGHHSQRDGSGVTAT